MARGSWWRRGARAASCLVAAAALAACQTAPKRAEESPFPSSDELEKLGPPPGAESLPQLQIDDVDAFSLEGPLPDRVELVPHAAASPWESVLDAAVARRAGLAVASEATHCAAREIGRFVLLRGKLPPPSLTDFIAARCGVAAAEARPSYLLLAVPRTVEDDLLIEDLRPQVEALVQQSLAGGPVDAGLWFGRTRDRVVVSVVSAVRRVVVTPFSPVAAQGRVSFSGESLGAVNGVDAWINQGETGFAECAADPAVRLPRFAFSCPVAPGDDAAVIDVAAREGGRILSDGVLRVLARAPGAPAKEWARLDLAGTRVAPSEGAFPEAVAAALDGVRRRAGLRPLALSLPQSEQARELAPWLLASSIGAAPAAAADLAALGLLAGWRVGAPIKDAGIATALVVGSLDAGRWVDAALEHPMGRATLLGPDAQVLAVGTLVANEPSIVLAVATTYALFGDEDPRGAAAHVLERIAGARRARERSAPQPLARVQPIVDRVAHELPPQGADPKAALEEALAAASAELGRPVRGVWMEGLRIEDVPIPEELLAQEPLRLAVSVGYYQPAGEPWGRTVVFVIVLPEDVRI